MTTNVEIDDTILTNQPSGLEMFEAEGGTARATGGGFIGSTRDEGRRIRITWGIGVSVTAAMAELRTARGGTMAHKLEFDDVSGVHHTIQVLWKANPSYRISEAQQYRSYTIEFLERAA